MTTDNIYKAPEADLHVDNSEIDEFFAVSTRKLWIMHMLTFTVYDVYWFYRHWNHLKLKHNLSVWPAVRGVFFIFFVYATFKRIQEAAEAKGLENIPNLKMLAVLWYVLFLTSFCLGIWLGMSNPELLLESLWITPALTLGGNLLTGFLLAPAQRTANRVIGDDDGSTNDRLTGANFAWIALMVLYYGLSWAQPLVN